MPLYLKTSTATNSWRKAASLYLKTSTATNSWRKVVSAFIKTADGWQLIFGVVGPQIETPLTISSNSTSYPATLTGRNYHWDSGTTFTSKFQKSSSAAGSWSDVTTFESILNPPSGSSNTKTLLLLESHFILNQSSTFFRFVVRAQDSVSGKETTEFSPPIEISVPDAVMSHTGGPIVSTSTTISIPFTQNSFLDYYIVETYGPSGLVSSTTVTTPTSPVFVQGLSPSTTYDIVVYPYNFVNMVGTALLGIGISTLAPDPSPPTITSSSSTTTSITLNFVLGANSTSTRAYINGNFDGGTSSTSYTFFGLAPGTSYTLALFGYNGTQQSSTSSGGTYSTQTGPALTPTFGSNISTTGGFFGSVTNYDANYTWGIYASIGTVTWSSPSGSTRAFTVSGLSAGQSSTVTVTTSRTGYNNGSAQTTGSASAPVLYTVTWNANGGSVSPSSNTVNAGASVTPPTPTRSGYTFNYWRNPLSGGDPIIIYAGVPYTPTGNITFYAIWTQNVSVPSGGTVSISTNTGNYQVGSVITFSTSGWSGSPTSYSLMLHNGTNPVLQSDPLRASTSSTSGTYTITSVDVPNYFKAFATATNSAGTSAPVGSVQVGPATSAPVTPAITSGPTISWASGNNFTLSAGASNATNIEFQVEFANNSGGPALSTQTFFMGASAGSTTTGSQQYSWARTRARANNSTTGLSSAFTSFTGWV